MGGNGSGRKSGSTSKPTEPDKLDPGEIIGETGGTTIDRSEPKKKNGRPAKGLAVNVAEAKQKLNLLFGGLARILGKEYTYTENDFDAEAQAVVRLSQKFSMVSYVLTLLDPLFMALALVQKFVKLPSKKKQPEQNQQQGQQPGQVVNFQR